MNGTQLAALIRKKTKTTSTTYSDADLLVDINIMKDEISGMIAHSKEEAFNVEVDDDLLADTRIYPYQTDLMNQLVRIELMFVDGNDYVLATPIKLSNAKIPIQEENIVNQFSDEEPKYLVRGKHIIILSGSAITAVTAGLKWIYKIFPSDLADLVGSTELSTDTSATALGFPREFQELLARRVSIEYKDTNNKKLSKKELEYDRDLDAAIDRFDKPVSSGETFLSLPEDNTDDGFDL